MLINCRKRKEDTEWWRWWSWFLARCCVGVHLQILRKMKNNFSQGGRYSDRDSKHLPPENTAKIHSLHQSARISCEENYEKIQWLLQVDWGKRENPVSFFGWSEENVKNQWVLQVDWGKLRKFSEYFGCSGWDSNQVHHEYK